MNTPWAFLSDAELETLRTVLFEGPGDQETRASLLRDLLRERTVRRLGREVVNA